MLRAIVTATFLLGSTIGATSLVSYWRFSDPNSTQAILRGQKVVITPKRIPLTTSGWQQLNFEVRNLTGRAVQLQGVRVDGCDMTVTGQFPRWIQPLSADVIASVVSRNKLNRLATFSVFLDGRPHLVRWREPAVSEQASPLSAPALSSTLQQDGIASREARSILEL